MTALLVPAPPLLHTSSSSKLTPHTTPPPIPAPKLHHSPIRHPLLQGPQRPNTCPPAQACSPPRPPSRIRDSSTIPSHRGASHSVPPPTPVTSACSPSPAWPRPPLPTHCSRPRPQPSFPLSPPPLPSHSPPLLCPHLPLLRPTAPLEPRKPHPAPRPYIGPLPARPCHPRPQLPAPAAAVSTFHAPQTLGPRPSEQVPPSPTAESQPIPTPLPAVPAPAPAARGVTALGLQEGISPAPGPGTLQRDRDPRSGEESTGTDGVRGPASSPLALRYSLTAAASECIFGQLTPARRPGSRAPLAVPPPTLQTLARSRGPAAATPARPSRPPHWLDPNRGTAPSPALI